jgi:hypothetical protein
MLEAQEMQYTITIEYYHGLYTGQIITRAGISKFILKEVLKEITNYQRANADIYISSDNGMILLDAHIEYMYTNQKA